MKVCSTCNQEKNLSEFHQKTKSPDGYEYRCKECTKERNKAYYRMQKAVIDAMGKEARSVGCVICGILDPVVIQLHHVEPKGRHWSTTLSIKAAKKEMQKCVPICANCHLRIHAGCVTLPVDAKRALADER